MFTSIILEVLCVLADVFVWSHTVTITVTVDPVRVILTVAPFLGGTFVLTLNLVILYSL